LEDIAIGAQWLFDVKSPIACLRMSLAIVTVRGRERRTTEEVSLSRLAHLTYGQLERLTYVRGVTDLT
jgi:hypothetical protein